MYRRFLLVVAVVAILFSFVDFASAQCGVNRGFGLRQAVIGNQIVTFDRFGNVVDRDFIGFNRGLGRGVGRNVTVINNRSLLGINRFGRRSLSDRLLFGF